MSEGIKRVPLQSLEFPDRLEPAKKDKDKGKQVAPSLRFDLALHESNEKAYPEFNYAQLVKLEEKKRKKLKRKNGNDPFEDDDEDDQEKMREMARKFNMKYGQVGKKKSKNEDYVDLGAGYDESDSFIDNTDAYDEIVPEELTTDLDGFYVNSGDLLYKNVKEDNAVALNNNNNDNDNNEDTSESSDEDDESGKELDKGSGSSSSGEENIEDHPSAPPRKKSKIEENGEKKSHENATKKRKKSQSHHSNGNHHKHSKHDTEAVNSAKEKTDSNGKSDHGEKKRAERSEVPKVKSTNDKKIEAKKTEKKVAMSNGLVDVKKMEVKKVGGPKEKSIENSIERVINAAKGEDESSRDTIDSGKSGRAAGTESDNEDHDKEPKPLPEGLSEEVKSMVNKLKAYLEANKDVNKARPLTTVNSMLLSLEKKLHGLSNQNIRIQTFAHLSYFFKCGRATILSRVKKLYSQEAESRAKEPMQRLKTIIDGAMPSVMERYTKDCQKAAEEKGIDGSPAGSEKNEGDEKSSEKSKIPKKRFPWTEESKKLVNELTRIRRSYFNQLRSRKETQEQFIQQYLESKVLPLWPPGWMHIQTLVKYSSESNAKKHAKKLKDAPEVVKSIPSSDKSNHKATPPKIVQEDVPAVSFPSDTTVVSIPPSSSQSSNRQDQQSSFRPKDYSADKRVPTVKYKEKPPREESHASVEVVASPTPKISVVPTSQLLAHNTTKPTVTASKPFDKFNLMELTSGSSLSITPVNEYQIPQVKDDPKKDVVSITAFPEHLTVSEVPHSRSQETALSQQSSSYQIPKQQQQQQQQQQNSLQIKPATKHRTLELGEQPIRDTNSDKINESFDLRMDKDNKKIKYLDGRKALELKKQKKQPFQKFPDPFPISYDPEQERRLIEETDAATSFLSQIINDDTPRMPEKRKDPSEDPCSLMQASEQEKDVQMVMKSLKELHEYQNLRYSPSHSTHHSSLQKSSKPSMNYLGFHQDDYQRLSNEDSNKRLKDEHQW